MGSSGAIGVYLTRFRISCQCPSSLLRAREHEPRSPAHDIENEREADSQKGRPEKVQLRENGASPERRQADQEKKRRSEENLRLPDGKVRIQKTEQNQPDAVRGVEAHPRLPHRRCARDDRKALLHARLQRRISRSQLRSPE